MMTSLDLCAAAHLAQLKQHGQLDQFAQPKQLNLLAQLNLIDQLNLLDHPEPRFHSSSQLICSRTPRT